MEARLPTWFLVPVTCGCSAPPGRAPAGNEQPSALLSTLWPLNACAGYAERSQVSFDARKSVHSPSQKRNGLLRHQVRRSPMHVLPRPRVASELPRRPNESSLLRGPRAGGWATSVCAPFPARPRGPTLEARLGGRSPAPPCGPRRPWRPCGSPRWRAPRSGGSFPPPRRQGLSGWDQGSDSPSASPSAPLLKETAGAPSPAGGTGRRERRGVRHAKS